MLIVSLLLNQLSGDHRGLKVNDKYDGIDEVCLFVCVEVLRPSQPNGVMLSMVSLPNHTFTGQA